MKQATLINFNFGITVYPDLLRYSPKTDMYQGELLVQDGDAGTVSISANLVDVHFQIFCTKWSRVIQIPTEIEGETTEGTEFVNFGEPVLFDSGVRSITYSLYLLLESYRNEPSTEKLEIINQNVQFLKFENSLAGFTMEVGNVQ